MYKNYAKLRDKKGLTDYAVSLATGIPQSTIYDWKQRSQRDENAGISAKTLVKLAMFFGVGIEAFV